jgi:hypothetical protein
MAPIPGQAAEIRFGVFCSVSRLPQALFLPPELSGLVFVLTGFLAGLPALIENPQPDLPFVL